MTEAETRVLVVDDDPMSVELILEHLEGPGYAITTAGDGLEAWEILQERPEDFDVVLLDRMMPRMDGMEVLTRIKSDARLKPLPVIMQTAVADRPEIIRGIDAGAYYYLTKPFEGEVLESMVRAAAYDYDRYRELLTEVHEQAAILTLLSYGVFEYRTLEEATALGTYLANACPDPERVVLGLNELLMNAVEHGNLEISYEEKSRLHMAGKWRDEIERRLESKEYGDRHVTVRFEREADRVTVSIRDQGPGFDPAPYLEIDPTRVFDSHGRGIAIANLLSFDSLRYRDSGREAVAAVNLSP
jgi:DNA-binding response OmpR family regulator/anti-sigma regulatory factor (Ser/Thr protein kinase)